MLTLSGTTITAQTAVDSGYSIQPGHGVAMGDDFVLFQDLGGGAGMDGPRMIPVMADGNDTIFGSHDQKATRFGGSGEYGLITPWVDSYDTRTVLAFAANDQSLDGEVLIGRLIGDNGFRYDRQTRRIGDTGNVDVANLGDVRIIDGQCSEPSCWPIN